jgi:hypothetical protein
MYAPRILVLLSVVFAVGLLAARVAAQDPSPIVESEEINSTPFSVHLSQGAMVEPATEPQAKTPEIQIDAKVEGLPPIVSPSNARLIVRETLPTPLSSADTAFFEGLTLPVSKQFFSTDENGSTAMPRMTKMFSFSTSNRQSNVTNAIAHFDANLTMKLATPEAVPVNQIFQQFVQIHNSGDTTQRAIRVTQVCDLSVLGAERQQAVVIDCIGPGETKTVRFSARARQPGSFSVRYVAENSEAQADVDDVVLVEDSGISVDFVGPSRMLAGDEGEWRVSIRNDSADDLTQLRIRCEMFPVDSIEFRSTAENTVESPIGEQWIDCIAAGQTETTTLRFSALKSGPLRGLIRVESNGQTIATRAMQISVVARPR